MNVLHRWALVWVPLLIAGELRAQVGPDATPIEIKIATVAPDNTAWMRDMRAGAARIREMTDGRIVFKFYPGGVQGDDAAVLRLIRAGQLQGGAFTAGGLSGRYNGLNTYGIPLLFRSLDEVDYVRSHLDAKIAAGLEEAGFVSLGFSEVGFANFFSNAPISDVDDLRGKDVWVPDGDGISYQVLSAFDIVPIEAPVIDVLTGLQTGLLDVVAASPYVALILEWHTKVRYRTELPVSYSMGVFVIDARFFNRLRPGDREVIRSVVGEVMAGINRDSRSDNAEAREKLAEIGIAPVAVDRGDVEGWRDFIESLYPRLRQRRDIDAELFDEMLALLDAYRSGNADAAPVR